MAYTLHDTDYTLVVRQQPERARVAIGKEKDRKPIDPYPIVQLNVSPRKDPGKTFLQNPYLMLTARLLRAHKDGESPPNGSDLLPEAKENDLLGTVVSSLYSLKDTDNTQGGFFVFGDLSVRKEGIYKLEFILFELKMSTRECLMRARTESKKFKVYPHKEFPGLDESTFLTRSFSDQGVRLRLRKDSRNVTTRKRNLKIAHTFGEMRDSAAHQQQYGPNHGSPEVSPIGQPHHLRRSSSLHDSGVAVGHMDRSRGSMGPQGSPYFSESPQSMRGEYGGAYGYAGGYDERSNKRQRTMDSGDGNHNYDSGYSPYAQAGPRTVPDPMAQYPISSSFAVPPTQTAMAGLPIPSHPTHYSSAPRTHDGQLHPERGVELHVNTFSPYTNFPPDSQL
ncbi:velvet factor-domain-containing protein [Lasiosphaeria miniovina]|uniref:Velvet factor-domain-containing protein n=1 Tax=Lasiosphaeria miniovina TaxID=1954250 RepID=A0AA40A5M2_9PEZI|nr:velvet factor-domain-containing protein [Lasiosphaeria miniovina]KAK0709660.1 velvet factor-domain-containing protein [Lasiosphaeria miniovina]